MIHAYPEVELHSFVTRYVVKKEIFFCVQDMMPMKSSICGLVVFNHEDGTEFQECFFFLLIDEMVRGYVWGRCYDGVILVLLEFC